MGKHNQRLLELLEQKGKSLYKLLFRLTLSEEVAEELLQELFVRLGKLKRCPEIENLYAYARKTAVNLAFDYYRRSKRDIVSLEGIEENLSRIDSPVTELVKCEEISELLEAVSRLKGNLRQVVVMRYIEEQSYEEIGEAIGTTSHQARALCSRGIKKLKERLRTGTRNSAK